MRISLLALAAALPALPVLADTVRFEFSGVVETSTDNLGLGGTVLGGTGTAYTAVALFDRDVPANAPDIFGGITFPGALIALEADFGGEVVTLSTPGDVRQSGADLVTASFGRRATAITPGIDALDGTVNGVGAVFGNFQIASFPGEDDFFDALDDLLSGVGPDGIAFDRTSFDTFEITFEQGFLIADIAEGVLSIFEDEGEGGDGEGDGEGGDGGNGEGGDGGEGPGGGDTPTPVPLPAGGLLLLAALAALRLRR